MSPLVKESWKAGAIAGAVVAAITIMGTLISVGIAWESKADAEEVARNANDIAVLLAQEEDNKDDHARLEEKLDFVISHLLED